MNVYPHFIKSLNKIYQDYLFMDSWISSLHLIDIQPFLNMLIKLNYNLSSKLNSLPKNKKTFLIDKLESLKQNILNSKLSATHNLIFLYTSFNFITKIYI
jgi:hypothetical protein